ncbi:MAG: RluA family pseudouridine synthase [Dehalococcoidia bacterium]|nr:RluA family pseudouridine synthase [Dehalococcoidia bacterium]
MGSAVDGQHGERTELVVAEFSGRADAVLSAAFATISRAQIARLISDGRVSLDGEPVKKSAWVQTGQSLLVLLADEAPSAGSAPASPLPVLYEDDHVVAIDKPAGLIAHPALADTEDTVSGWFAARYPELCADLDPARPGIVHRLDRDTTGIMVLAKTPGDAATLSAAFESRTVKKTYIAICNGVPEQERAVIDAPVGRHPGDRGRMAVVRDGSAREARTAYEVLGQRDGKSLLVVHPESGRTHQVRVHLSAIGAPVLDDPLYGTPGHGRHQLHAALLSLPHPAGGTLNLQATLPRDMAARVRSMGLAPVASEYLQPSSAARSSAPE